MGLLERPSSLGIKRGRVAVLEPQELQCDAGPAPRSFDPCMIDRVALLSRRCLRWIEQRSSATSSSSSTLAAVRLWDRARLMYSPTVPLATRVAEAIGSCALEVEPENFSDLSHAVPSHPRDGAPLGAPSLSCN